MNEAVEARLRTNTTEYWIATLNAAGVPCGRVLGLGEVFSDPQVLDQEMVLSQGHPPENGADTDAVLGEFGYSADEISVLRRTGIV
jgi:crotonobetainyl-CoA:carnitine CoA-transferase CaiB-like acyl-CoA transferase